MAQWERDPRLRRHLTWALAAAEAVAVSVNFYFIFSAYMYRILMAVSPSSAAGGTTRVAAVAATVACVVVMAVLGFLYARGRGWVRPVFIAGNGFLILLGLVWFLHNLMGRDRPDAYATYCGLLLPLVTLLPLLWPLLSLRPTGSSPFGQGGS
jgi:hypothetical protein